MVTVGRLGQLIAEPGGPVRVGVGEGPTVDDHGQSARNAGARSQGRQRAGEDVRFDDARLAGPGGCGDLLGPSAWGDDMVK